MKLLLDINERTRRHKGNSKKKNEHILIFNIIEYVFTLLSESIFIYFKKTKQKFITNGLYIDQMQDCSSR